MKNIENILAKGLACLMPVYEPGEGNAVKLIADDGSTFIVPRTIKTVLNLICRYYMIHIEACRARYGKILNQRLGVPLAIHGSMVLIPLKLRKPLLPKDGAYGYVNLYSIEGVEECQNHTRILLKGNVRVLCLQRLHTTLQQINKAKVIAADMPHSPHTGGDRVHDFYVQYNTPATRGDIARLQLEILELRDILKRTLVSSQQGVAENEGIQIEKEEMPGKTPTEQKRDPND
ncbi:MAG TPA: hypothetical protein GX503_04835 [Clostridiales bacterium]|nr:hypothetical protein [Clostridiales bacterium]